MCRNIAKSSFKVGHTRLARFFSLSKAPMRQEGHWYARARCSLKILWHHKAANEEKQRILYIFSCFLRWNFLKAWVLHNIYAYFRISFFDKISSRDFSCLIINRPVQGFVTVVINNRALQIELRVRDWVRVRLFNSSFQASHYHNTYPFHPMSYSLNLNPTWRTRALETSLVWDSKVVLVLNLVLVV